MEIKQPFIHHVFFWLKNPESEADKNSLFEGLQLLSGVPTIQTFHIGQPASTNRSVIETSYSFSWLATFNSLAEEEIYQTHPIHLLFIEQCKHLWDKVIVYDSVK
jgi:hypothetical protein